MILDYFYNQTKKTLNISYVKDTGGKSLMSFNVERFKTYYRTENGRFTNWDGKKCDVKFTKNPHKFDIRTFILEMQDNYKKLLRGKVAPKLYTYDIEVLTESDEIFPEPSIARWPITTISVVNSNLEALVLGTRPLSDEDNAWVCEQFKNYINGIEYFHKLGIPMPSIRYVYFESEHDMLKFFLTNVVAKSPALAGWNSMLFDWQYIQNRIRFYYDDLTIEMGSIDHTSTVKKYTDQRGNAVNLTIPNHTLLLDMMDVIGTFDMVVMPIKESLSLDYISSETIKAHKIQYDGSLNDLYKNDYRRYVFYNAIDSVLVQLLDRYFKTLQNIYTQSLYCMEKIGACFSKISLTEALVFNKFFEMGIKVVPDKKEIQDRGELVGAYVRQPIPGLYKYICCNDFASLYPSTIITCNLSFENYIGNGYTEEQLEIFRHDKNYFVSVNGCVYKNDKPYLFKIIQSDLKSNRNTGKYLAKQLEAQVISDLDHIVKKIQIQSRQYAENMVRAMEEIGYKITCTDDLYNIDDKEKFRDELEKEIVFYTSFEQSMKLLGNSMYGGSSHVAFFWFNMNLANDITGEARNLIHLMEHHIPEYLTNEWETLTDLHNMLGVKIDHNKLSNYKKQNESLVEIVYGDTDSLYISYERLLSTIIGYDSMSLLDIRELLVKFNTEFMDGHNREFMREYFDSRHVISIQDFELETIALSGVWLDVKKRYAQILIWKDGKYYDLDDLPMKVKGLEIVKSSVPTQARKGLKRMVRYLLEDDGKGFLLQRLNIKMMQELQAWNEADLEDVCGNMKVNGYTKYIVDDTNPMGLITAPKCPANVKALGNYNRIRNVYKLSGDPIYGGKIKWYLYYPINSAKTKKGRGKGSMKTDAEQYFGFQSRNYPKWADKYAPISRSAMFQQFMLDPFNRIINAIGLSSLNIDGSISMSLF